MGVKLWPVCQNWLTVPFYLLICFGVKRSMQSELQGKQHSHNTDVINIDSNIETEKGYHIYKCSNVEVYE